VYRIPEGLPAFTAVTTASTLFVFGVSACMVEMSFGRLGSPTGLALIFLPLWSGLFGLVGLVLGALVLLAWKTVSYRRIAAEPARPWLTRAFFSLQGVALVSGAGLVLHVELQAAPRVILDRGIVEGVPVPTADTSDRRKAELLWQDDEVRIVKWGSNETSVDLPRPSRQAVLVSDASRGVVLRLSNPALDPVILVEAAPLRSGKGGVHLVVAVTGGSFPDRALITVLAADYEVIYRELIERTGCFDEPILETVSHRGRDIVVLGAPECATKALTVRR